MRTLMLMLFLAAPCCAQTLQVEHKADWRKIAVLSSAQLSLDLWDMAQTRSAYLDSKRLNKPFQEYNPLTNSLLPHPRLLYARPVITAAFSAFLSYKLSTSRKPWLRRLRYVPQYVQITLNSQGIIYSHYH